MEKSREYPGRPFVGVGVVVFQDESVLLIRRGNAPRKGEWSLPGGSQELGETVRETAAREVLEETGVVIGEPRFLEVIDSIVPDDVGRVRFHYTLIEFWAEWRRGVPAAADDAAYVEWVSLERLKEMEIWEATRRVILDAAASRAVRDQ